MLAAKCSSVMVPTKTTAGSLSRQLRSPRAVASVSATAAQPSSISGHLRCGSVRASAAAPGCSARACSCCCPAHCLCARTSKSAVCGQRGGFWRRSAGGRGSAVVALRAAAESAPEPEASEAAAAAAAAEPAAAEEGPAEEESTATHPLAEKLVDRLSACELPEATCAELQAIVDEVNDALTQKEQLLEQSMAEIDSLKDQCLRLNADFDNFRKRTNEQAEQQKQQVKGNILEDLLPVVDNFELAKTQLKLETEAEQKVDASYQGLYKQLVDTLAKMGLTPVMTVGSQFDPNLMDAIQSVPTAEATEGTVLQEFRMGFKLGDRLLRPAMVQVAAAPAGPASEAEGATVDTTAEEK